MLLPNPHTFPLVAYPGLAPELAVRSGMGGWEPYALDAPSDRLLPFVLARRKNFRNAAWISCLWIEHADTGARIETLMPTAAPVFPATVPSLGVVFSKQTDGDTEYFTYDGAFIPDLDLPCGVPLRLIVDTQYQSPRFVAIRPAAALGLTHLLMEWYHDGPLQSVPYGRGFRQRLYIDNGSLQPAEPVTKSETTPDPNGGIDRLASFSLFAVRAFTLAPVPAYLFDAVTCAPAVKYLLADGEPWRLTTVKTTAVGDDGGRWSIAGTLQDETPLLRRGCQSPALTVAAYPTGYVPRGWRCGDTSDVAPDFVPTGIYSCEMSGGLNTGYVIETTQDINPESNTYGQTGTQLSTSPDLVRCPIHPPGARLGVNKTVTDSRVSLDFARTDTIGDLMVTADVEAEVTAGGVLSTQTFTQSFTIPAGSAVLNGALIPYGGASLVAFHYLRLTSIAPNAYIYPMGYLF